MTEPTTDQAALRDRIAEAAHAVLSKRLGDGPWTGLRDDLADAVLAVLNEGADELAKQVARAIWALKSPPPPGSQHYQSGWDDGLDAVMDAARDAVTAVLPAPAENEALWNELHRRDTEADQPHATDQTALRDRIAQELASFNGWEWAAANLDKLNTPGANRYRAMADAVLAVVPAPADRAAVLREAAEHLLARCPHLGKTGALRKCTCPAAVELLRLASQEPGAPDYASARETVLRRLAAEPAPADTEHDDSETPTWSDVCPHCKRWYTTSEPGAHEATCPMKPAAEARGAQQDQAHVCRNCAGIDPDSCLFNPDRPKKPPMDPVHILGIDAEPPAAVQQPKEPRP